MQSGPRTRDSGATAEPTVVGLFGQSAAAAPDAIAVALGEEQLSYRELARRSGALGRRLAALGVGPEVLVGLAVERSVEMVVGLLGVLTAGGAYVPLDPSYPAERLGFMWRDACRGQPPGAPLVLLASPGPELPPELAAGGTEVVLLGGEARPPAGDGAASGPESGATAPAGAGHLAYVIYTSGTTGRPKGVPIAHQGVVNVVRENARLLRVGRASRVLQLASLSFDASVLEIFTALATGARLVLTPRETLLSGAGLAGELARHRITTLAIPPSLLDTVPEGDEPPGLTDVVVGGEACSAATAERWAPGRNLVNAYAPTEATVYATAGRVEGPFDRPPTLGRPIAGRYFHLLDHRGSPVSAGEAGEIHLGGLGLARGYLNRPALTADRFVPDPFDPPAPGARLYRTGDLARCRPDGELEFVGRTDHQVKIRGFRIELEEIETHLARHPGVRGAAVAARRDAAAAGDDPGSERRLVAYVVPRERPEAGEGTAAGPAVRELRSFLAGSLPDYMVPAAFVFLDELPMAPTGKVDRRALPAPGRGRPDLATPYVPPRDSTEAALAAIWGELLSIDGVGVRDDLFALGGHSLLAAQISSRVRQRLGRELPLQAVFEHPTVEALARYLAAGGADGDETAAPPPLPAIEPAPRDRPIPLSFPQERVWFLLQLAPGAIAYNFQFTLHFRGGLQLRLLARALAELVRRHEVLRTTFPAVEGQPVQVVHAPWRPRLPVVDLSGLDAPAARAEAERRVAEGIRQSFDVTRLPLLSWVLFRLGAGEDLLLHVEHHFVHDGWSLAVFLRELKALYAAFQRGEPSPLLPPTIQYADFAVWQRRWLTGEVLTRQLAYWKARLAGPLPVLELPADRPRPRRHSFRGGALRVDLPAEIYAETRAFSRRQGMTLFMTMLAAFDTLLYRYTGEEDLVLGSGVANRRLRETEDLVGMVVNTVVFRQRLSGELSGRELLAAVRRTVLETHVHQDLPFEKLVRELAPDRDLARNPIFNVLFSFHDAPVPDLEFVGLTAEIFERHNGSAKADLNVVAKPLAEQRVGRRPAAGGDALTMVWEYSSDLFDGATVERMWGHYQTLLAGLVAQPHRPLAALPLLTAGERRQLAAWNRATRGPQSPAAQTPVPLQVAARAAAAPDALAVTAGGACLSYGAVAAGARALAARLRRGGAGAGALVALLTGRSPEMVVGALGVLWAGGAYLPLDPAYPQERLAFMLADAGVWGVLVRRGLEEVLPASAPALPAVALDAGAAAGAATPAREAPASPLLPELAYVIYTSGSTGRPKGVEVTHGGLANLAAWHRRAYRVAAGDRATLLAGPGFDASVWETWPYLAAGASLHVPDDETRAAPVELLAWLARRRISVSFLATPLAEAALEEAAPAGLALRYLLTGGDRLRRAPAPGLPFRLVNHYGPTESTVVTTAGEVAPRSVGASAAAPSIGRPIDHLRVYLLDRDGGRLPVGVPGELAVAGAGVARGYHARPGLTAERFRPDPWCAGEGGEAGDRLYRSGDLARFRPDGRLDFLGRRDHQVQVRGFRVEPGEIEAVLAEHPGVAEAVVMAGRLAAGELRWPPAEGEVVLVAYAVAVAGGEPSAGELAPGELTEWLRQRLPDYMVPAEIVFLPALPLTPNGKVDRQALPRPHWAGGEGGPPRARPPRTPLEELLADLWARFLERPEVAVDDDFFRLGGHSLLATRLLARVRDAAGVDLPLSALFEAPTVAGFAAAIEERLRQAGGEAGEGAPRPAAGSSVHRRRGGGPAPLTFAQERLWFLDRLAPGGAAYNIARALRLRGSLDVPALAAAFQAVVDRHDALRTTFDAGEGEPVQRVSPALPAALPFLDLGRLPGAAAVAERLAAGEARRPFDLAAGPLLRLRLLRLAPAEHLLVIAVHHIVADGWSLPVLYREVGAGYRAAAAGEAPALPQLPVQVPDFAVWQRRRLRGALLAARLAYWRRHLAGAPARLELPTDRPRPVEQGFRGGQVTALLPVSLVDRVTLLARKAGATPFMALLAAFAAVLDRWAQQGEVVVGTPVAGRDASEIEGLIGFFVNTLPLRLRLGDRPGFSALLARARQATLGGHAHQDLPFEKLVEELAPVRNLGHSPLFQVLLAFQSTPGAELELPGVEVAAVAVERRESRFDLELAVAPAAEGWQVALRYDRDLFDATTARRLLGMLPALLAAAVEEPDRPLAERGLLAAAERHQLLREWNDPASDLPTGGRPATLDALFAEQAARTPDRPALASAGGELTYRELAGRAARLARELRRRGVGPEVPVAVLLDRGPELVAALLAVLAAGGAYVPLDPAYPRRRLELILGDTRAPVAVTSRARAGALPAGGGVQVVAVEEVEAGAGEEGAAAAGTGSGGMDTGVAVRAEGGALPGNLAYVIYTSGSTGAPKGVAIEHRSAAALLAWARQTFPPPARAGVLAATSVCFDLSVFELFLPLTTGGEVILADNVLALARHPRAGEVTLVNTVPSAVAELLELGDLPASVATVNLAGEPLRPALADELYRRGVPRVHDLYGPSEDTTYSTFCRRRPGGAANIGRPLPGTRCFLLDRQGRPVPRGAAGELHLGGAGLARGYLGRPARTAERFVPDPWSGAAGERLYRTGDLARHLPGGELQFLGRLDHQVKLRGYRIELGEVEAALASQPGVKAAVALVREDRTGDPRLVAYTVAVSGKAVRTAELRRHLGERLPDYMMPALFVALEALPRTATGKVDRRALPAPAGEGRGGEFVPPETPEARRLAALWSEVLGVERVGLADNFFDLGGHSLLATRVIARLPRELGVELPLRALFQEPTLGGFATLVRRAGEAGGEKAAPRITRASRQERLRQRSSVGDGPLPKA